MKNRLPKATNTPIKLRFIDTLECGTTRLCSQLFQNRGVADFLLKNGKLYCWYRNNYEECDIPYEIVHHQITMQLL